MNSSSSIKEEAVKLRRSGATFNEIIAKLGIPKSTLSYWLKGVTLTQKQKVVNRQKWLQALVDSRVNAIKWHNSQKEERLRTAKDEANLILQSIGTSDTAVVELALAMLYLGEGTKKSSGGTALGNSDPDILRFFIFCLKKIYGIKDDQLKCYLHLRMDQEDNIMKQFWSTELGLPITNFLKTSFDKRTIGKPTYKNYNGVCVVYCGQVAIQRRLAWISKLFCEKISTTRP